METYSIIRNSNRIFHIYNNDDSPYQCIDWLLIRYIPNHTNVSMHGMMEHTDKPICVVRIDPLLDRYILSI